MWKLREAEVRGGQSRDLPGLFSEKRAWAVNNDDFASKLAEQWRPPLTTRYTADRYTHQC
jgi:hypothetical protein